MVEEQEVKDPGDALRERLEQIQVPPTLNKRTLEELLYTATERGLIEGISYEDAITVGKLMQLATMLGKKCPEEFRM
jgi:hypothetical protein